MTDVLYRKASGTRLQRSGLSAAASAPLQVCRKAGHNATLYSEPGPYTADQRRTRALRSEPAWLGPERLGHGDLVEPS
jgi:hypothetical protein